MIRKVISGGQSGVERAALDVARKLHIGTGGWITPWQAEANETLVSDYRLRVLDDLNFVRCAEINVRAAQGVLILSRGSPAGKSALYHRLASELGRFRLYLDLNCVTAFEAANRIEKWIKRVPVEILGVTGPVSCKNEDIYVSASAILDVALQLTFMDSGPTDAKMVGGTGEADRRLEEFMGVPETLEKALDILDASLNFQDRTRLANMPEQRLYDGFAKLRTHIKNEFRLWGANRPLLNACRHHSRDSEEEPAAVIVRLLRRRLRQSGDILKVIK